ncbi:ABC transporter permease [Daejeonella sp.]|uniref:ABC transporter permease n=1 Tax=Daejeonella sp. TaxID=2805397 RepID=UPI002726E2BA|nr:ABC transporter permease [Daejeonella sp.]MDO8994873.1 ABC transporter permease [Daejeonella sp.]MDP2413033.1 ABC transporter permease [Daejeonella sp.]
MKRFFLNTKTEFLKSKGTAAVWLTILAALFIPVIYAMVCLERPDVMVKKINSDPWMAFLRMNWKNVAAVILPLYCVLMTSLIIQIEYRNNTWKQVYTLPRKFADVFFSKFIVIHSFLIGFILLFSSAIIISGLSVARLNPAYHLLSKDIPWMMLLIIASRIYLGLFAITIVQYWLSLRFKNFVVSLGIGMGLWITGIVLMDWDKIVYYPYMYSTFMFFTDFDKNPETLVQLSLCSIISSVLFLTLSFRDIYLLPERG